MASAWMVRAGKGGYIAKEARETTGPRTQRAVMRELFVKYGGDAERIISAYANAERSGEARRSSNSSGLKPEEYARALLNDGLKKGWL